MTMRSGAKILGLIGGIIGLIVGIFLLVSGLLGGTLLIGFLGEEGAEVGLAVIMWGVSIFVFAILGLVGGAITTGKPLPAGALMLVGGIGGFLAGTFWIVPGILLIIGGILSLVSLKKAT